MSDPEERPGVDTISLPGGRTALRLYGFPTDSAVLQHAHRTFLKRWVLNNYGRESRYRIVGMASSLRYRHHSEERNTELSLRRARAVEDFILEEMMALLRNRSGPTEIILPRFNVSLAGVGTQWNAGEEADINDPGHRAVLILDYPVEELPGMRIVGPEPTLTTHRRFYIKYCGSASAGFFITDADLGLFVIRDSNGWYQEYFYIGASLGPSPSPVSWGEAMPPRQGWVEFSAHAGSRVDSFGGKAQLSGFSIQGGPATLISSTSLIFGFDRVDRIRVQLPTGDGFSIGISGGGGGVLFGGDIRPKHDGRWRWL